MKNRVYQPTGVFTWDRTVRENLDYLMSLPTITPQVIVNFIGKRAFGKTTFAGEYDPNFLEQDVYLVMLWCLERGIMDTPLRDVAGGLPLGCGSKLEVFTWSKDVNVKQDVLLSGIITSKIKTFTGSLNFREHFAPGTLMIAVLLIPHYPSYVKFCSIRERAIKRDNPNYVSKNPLSHKEMMDYLLNEKERDNYDYCFALPNSYQPALGSKVIKALKLKVEHLSKCGWDKSVIRQVHLHPSNFVDEYVKLNHYS
jgi:hypothetical protein